jgi:proton-translocating NAD(P)+ transhydrogenase subunit alpha
VVLRARRAALEVPAHAGHGGLGVEGWFTKLLLVIAIAFGTINVVGGFLVTDRMLEMFKSKPKEQVETSEELQ